MKKEIFIFSLLLFLLVGCSTDNNTANGGNLNQGDNTQASPLSDFTFSEGESFSDDRDTGVEVLSLEEAVEIAAAYIYEVFEDSLEGVHIELVYNYNFNISERTWSGYVRRPERSNLIMTFLIDAQTGERIELTYWQREPLHGISFAMMESMSEAELLEIFPEPDEAEIAEMMDVVRDIAERHLQTSEIVRLEYGFLQENGEADTTYYPSQLSPFFVIDTEGRLIEIIIQRETHLLVSINTPFGF